MPQGDMFLKVEGARSGAIKGESRDETHREEIDILSWSWGMRAQTAMGGAGRASRASLSELRITKRVDSASTALMAAMRNNDLLNKVVLSVRKAGGTALEYFKITLENARVTLIEVQSGASDDQPGLMENLSIAYEKINVEYTPQGRDGQARGGMSFFAETGTA